MNPRPNVSQLVTAAALLSCAIFVIGCNKDDGHDGVVNADNEVQVDLTDGLAQWEAADLVDYSFEFQWSCFCVPKFTESVWIVVEDLILVSATYILSGEAVDASDLVHYLSIDELFQFLQDEVDNVPASIAVDFHPEWGYPEFATIDRSADIADDEIAFTVSNLEETMP